MIELRTDGIFHKNAKRRRGVKEFGEAMKKVAVETGRVQRDMRKIKGKNPEGKRGNVGRK